MRHVVLSRSGGCALGGFARFPIIGSIPFGVFTLCFRYVLRVTCVVPPFALSGSPIPVLRNVPVIPDVGRKAINRKRGVDGTMGVFDSPPMAPRARKLSFGI